MAQNPAYFVDHKRGEVNELKAILRNPKIAKDEEKKREVIRKVIAYMTLGIDVSKIFSEMVMAASTKDLVQKKMVYHYLCSYAQEKPDVTLLAINTLQKDCRDEDPMVRGLALRSLCSLRVPNIVEYVLMPVRQGLNDPSAYVRKTACMGCAKIYKLAPATIKDSDLVDVLYNILKDKDSAVITNAVCALNEILASEGKMAINQQIVLYLLNRLREFNEWGQCMVLELVSKYTPANEDEMFDIMNLLEDRLKHSNSAVVLGTTKVFLNFTASIPPVHAEVYKRLKAPLLTLMTGGSVELAYTVLSHISLLVLRAPGVFDDLFKHFFCRFNDPVCVKKLKLNILTFLANDRNFSDVVNELAEYVTDVDSEIARTSIKGIGRIGIKIDAAVDEAIEHLISFLDLNTDYITAEACIVMKDLLRKYPERYEDVIPAMQKCLKAIDETEGKVAVIWMIGEYGDTINDAPYILEPLIDGYAEEPSPAVRTELLTATMKLFFKRAPELKGMLGRLLAAAIKDTSQIDVRDRALMYYRLLRLNLQEAQRVVNCPKVIVDVFAEANDDATKTKIFGEFNTLSVVYGQPEERFIGINQEQEEEDKDVVKHEPTQTDALLEKEDRDPDDVKTPASPTSTAGGGALHSSGFPSTPSSNNSSSAPPTPAKDQPKKKELDFLGVDDLLSGDFSAPAAASSFEPAFELTPKPTIDPATFQSRWGQWSAQVSEFQIKLAAPDVLARTVESSLVGKNFAKMAHGQVGNQLKFYFYGRHAEKGLYLVECVIDVTNGRLVATFKAEDPVSCPQAMALFKSALGA